MLWVVSAFSLPEKHLWPPDFKMHVIRKQTLEERHEVELCRKKRHTGLARNYVHTAMSSSNGRQEVVFFQIPASILGPLNS